MVHLSPLWRLYDAFVSGGQAEWDKTKALWHLLLPIFGCCDQNFISRKEAGYSALFPLSLKIFLIFYSFLRFLRLFFFLVWAPRPPQQQKCRGDKFLRLVSFGNSSSNSHTKFRVLDIKSRFTCGELNLYWNVNVFKLLFPGLPEYFFFCPRRLW